MQGSEKGKTTSVREFLTSLGPEALGAAGYSVEEPIEITLNGTQLYAGNPLNFQVGEEVSLSCDVYLDEETLIPAGTKVAILEITPLPSVHLATVRTVGGVAPGKVMQVKLPLLLRSKI